MTKAASALHCIVLWHFVQCKSWVHRLGVGWGLAKEACDCYHPRAPVSPCVRKGRGATDSARRVTQIATLSHSRVGCEGVPSPPGGTHSHEAAVQSPRWSDGPNNTLWRTPAIVLSGKRPPMHRRRASLGPHLGVRPHCHSRERRHDMTQFPAVALKGCSAIGVDERGLSVSQPRYRRGRCGPAALE